MISDQERLDNFFPILEEVKKIAVQAHHLSGMRERFSLLTNGFAIVTPRVIENSKLGFSPIWVSSPNVRQDQLKIYPRFTQDEKLHSALSDENMARYGSHNRLYHHINLNVLAETRRYMAYVLIHELGHALVAEQRQLVMTEHIYSLIENISEEVDMRTFDYQLLLIIGGPEYQTSVDKTLYWIQKERRKWKQNQGPQPPFEKGHLLDSIFGAPNQENKSKRDSLFELLACMMDADKSFPVANATKLKHILVESYYKDKWL